MALFGMEGEKGAARIRVSGSEAAFAILSRVVVFPVFCVAGGRRTRVHREAFGGIFPRFSLIRDATRSQTGPTLAWLWLVAHLLLDKNIAS